jgi:large conductance mechanosensitive channel
MKDFRAFVLRGNVVELAIGVVIGAAFGAVVNSLVKDILTPLLGLLHVPDLSRASVALGAARVRYGLFVNAVVSLLLVSFAVFFFIVKPLNRLMALHQPAPDVESPKRQCPHCLSSIPREASVCAFCTHEVATADRAVGATKKAGHGAVPARSS